MSSAFIRGFRSVIAWPICWASFWIGHGVSLVIKVIPDSWPELPFTLLNAIYQRTMMWSVDIQDRYDLPHAPWRDA